MKKKIVSLFLTAGVLFSMSACGSGEKLLESTKEEKSVVMTAGGYDVPYELFRYVALSYKTEYEAGKTDEIWLGESGAALLSELNKDVENTISAMYLPLVLAEEYGLSPEDKVITESVDLKMKAVYESYDFDYKAYTDAIAEFHMNDGAYRFLMLNEVMTEELFHAMLLKGDIRNDEAYLSDVFYGDEFIRVKQILVSADNGKTEAENLAFAEVIMQKVNNGEDFDTLVQKYGQDLFMFNNTDGYYIMKGSFYEEFEDAAFSLEIGEVSDIVKTPAGFSIIKRYEKEEDYIKKNWKDLTDTYYDGVFNTILEARVSSVKIEKTDLYGKYSIFNME